MKFKNTLIALLILALACSSFAACAGDGEQNTEENTETDAPIDTSPVQIPDSLPTSLANFSFACEGATVPTEGLEFRVENGKAQILSYTGALTAVRIPDTLGGAPVTAIADSAFANNQSLVTLILPDGIKTLGTGILSGCTAIKYLQTPLLGKDAESAQYLGYLFGADSYKNNPRDVPATLETLSLCGEMATLSAYALFDCNDLQCLILSDCIRTVEKYALYNCTSLEHIEGLHNVLQFGDRALMNCAALDHLSLGKHVAAIGLGAFEGCDAIRYVTLPFVGGSRTENACRGYFCGAAYPDHAAGYYPRKLEKVTLYEGCTDLADYALFECKTLKEVVLPNGLERIGVRAFYGCEKLWSIKLPDSLTTLREAAFFGCDALLSIQFGKSLQFIGINAFYNCDSLTEIALPQTLKKLSASCFAGCISLRTVELGGVTEVGAQAFRGCDAIETVKASGKVTFGEGNDRVKNILELE